MRMNSRINVVQEINVKRNFLMLCKFSKVISCIRGGCAVKRIDISRVIQIIDCHIVAGGKSRQKTLQGSLFPF